MSLTDVYLIGYNNVCCVGWAMVWAIAVWSVIVGVVQDKLPVQEVLAKVYSQDGLSTVLLCSQTAALLEIVHAGTGLVRSPVVVTFMQVMSRIVAIIALAYSVEAQSKFFFLFK